MWSDSIARPFWIERLHRSWEKAPIVWLTGVRRVGKTTLAQALPEALFLNCDLPSTTRRVADPERFYATVEAPIVVFDEIHQLPEPSRLLKIGADVFPHLRILATGSSTLAATRKFRDSLTGRKRTVHLLPVLHRELESFGVRDLERRLLRGGLPDALLASDLDPGLYSEWLDSYFARDIQELFRIDKRREFLKLVELILLASGGQTEISRLAKHAGLSRPTVMSYLEALQVTHVATLLRPFHGGGRREILRQPKVYGFDTGFVSFCRGWRTLRDEDRSLLFEHLVLETLLSRLDPRHLGYWRDKEQREVDFVVARGDGRCDAIECKWDPERFSPRSLAAFRALHPKGNNYVVSPRPGPPIDEDFDGLEVTVCSLEEWESLQGR